MVDDVPTQGVRRALVRHLTDEGRRWLAFDHPVDHFVARHLHEVLPTLTRIEEAARSGRWLVGMIAYDAAPAFDSALVARRDERVPLVAFAAFDAARPSRGPAGTDVTVGPWRAGTDRDAHHRAIATIRNRIGAGDTYQVNHTMRLAASFAGDPEALFAGLCRAQRADHLAFLDLGDTAVCSASPELFLRRTGDLVETRPMKGTRPRHADRATDRSLADELVRSEKDRAENTMIVDMARNDLGRVARIGTVATTALHTVETYPTVHQLTSTVQARTDVGLADLLCATFPAASITGAPKVATSRLIASIEPAARGVYTGAVGVIAPGGDLELNVAIRTAWVDRRAATVTYGIGGGIVWDSDPDAEWHEAHHKARVVHRSVPPFRLLETLAWEPGFGAVLLDRHLRRLGRTSVHFGFEVDIDEVRRRVAEVDADGPRMLRLLVDADGAIELQEHARPPVGDPADPPLEVPLDREPVSSGDEFLRHKTTRRARYDEARQRFPDAPDVLLWNERGELTESTIANLVVELDGRLVTPPTRCGLLPGTLRAELLDEGRIATAPVLLDDVARCTGAWLVNSVRGWRPVRLVADHIDTPAAASAVGEPGA